MLPQIIPPARQALDEVCQCLSFSLTLEQLRTLRARLTAGGWDAVLRAASERSLLAALATAATDKQLLAGIPELTFPDGRMTASRAIAEGVARHQAIRAAKAERLRELIALLNRAGIEPILLKGARSLWTGTPGWRAMGDLDLLAPGRAAEAQALAIGAGYRPIAEYGAPEDWHHEANLYRADLPGWLEFHNRGAMARADLLLPTELLEAQSLRHTGANGAVARILPAPLDLLYCVVHHHVSHRGDKFGLMSLKGLYEFAAAFASLTPNKGQALARLAATHPRLVAILDLWLAAAVERLQLPVSPPFALEADAQLHWRRTGWRENRRGNYDGVLGELILGFSSQRLSRAAGGGTWVGRQRLRWKVVKSLLAPAVAKPS